MSDTRMPLIVSFLGWSDSGKTTLIAALAAERARRGRPCAAAKCTRHPGDFEPEGKDSARLRGAGAEPVAFIGTGEGGSTLLVRSTPPRPDRAWLLSLFPSSDLILVEGLEVEGAIRILVDDGTRDPKRGMDEIDICVSDSSRLRSGYAAAGKAAFPRSEAAAILDHLEATWTGK